MKNIISIIGLITTLSYSVFLYSCGNENTSPQMICNSVQPNLGATSFITNNKSMVIHKGEIYVWKCADGESSVCICPLNDTVVFKTDIEKAIKNPPKRQPVWKEL